MLKLEGLKLTPEEKEAALHRKAARLLRIPEEDVLSVQVLRRSIDAREELHLVYTVAAEVRQEKQVLRRCRDRRVSRFAPERYALPEVLSPPEVPPVVVGAGPGGLFAALVLARCGLRPILLERGQDTVTRQRDVETFWRTGVLDPESNVQFGEGGAGAFSDGKLNTGTKDLRHRWILEELVRCGAPESILTDAKPHVGTDMLHIALQNLRQELLSLGAQVRIEHRQRDMDAAQYRQYAGHPCLPASTYKLSCHTAAGRGVFSFCVCPGGQVVAAASEPGRVVTNGMSHYARSGENINGGMLVGVTPEDFGTDHPLAGVAWQRQLEAAAFRLGGGGFLAPCQRVEDFLAHRPSTGPGAVLPSYRPGVTWCDLHDCLPPFLTEAMEEALPLLERKLRGYAQPDALLTAVETRSSSPVRILRDESGQSALRGLYPCGEGAGYAGGILSAAADGMRCAEKIWEVYS